MDRIDAHVHYALPLEPEHLLNFLERTGTRRAALVLAVLLSLTSSLLSLYGPKLSGQAINAIDLGAGKVDFDTVFSCVTLMIIFYIFSNSLKFLSW